MARKVYNFANNRYAPDVANSHSSDTKAPYA